MPYETIRGINCASLPNGMFGLKVIWVHFLNLPKTQATGVYDGYGGVLGQFKENFNNKSKGKCLVRGVSLLHLKACN